MSTETVNKNGGSARTAAYWARYEPTEDSGSFYTSPVLRPYLIESAYGAELAAENAGNSWWAEDIFIAKYLAATPPRSVLSLCCGFGAVEQYLLGRVAGVESCLALDLSQGALEIARRRAAQAGRNIEYRCVDLNSYQWPENRFDLIIANGALHHIANLEAVLAGIKRALAPGGLLYACEYVGPNYMDHSIRQLELINACAFLVPPELRARKPLAIANDRLFHVLSRAYSVAARRPNPRWSPLKRRTAKLLQLLFKRDPSRLDFGKVYISPKSRLLRDDPSECVRSSEILPLARKFFGSVEVRPFGGGILQHALDENFYLNFDPANPRHTGALRRLIDLERELTESGEIANENAFIVCRRDFANKGNA